MLDQWRREPPASVMIEYIAVGLGVYQPRDLEAEREFEDLADHLLAQPWTGR